jgi:hypothetical protein
LAQVSFLATTANPFPVKIFDSEVLICNTKMRMRFVLLEWHAIRAVVFSAGQKMGSGFVAKHNFGCRKFFRRLHLLKERQSKMCSDLICLGLLHVATVGIRDFPVSTEFAEFCILSVVACLVVRPLVLPIFLDS